MNKMQRAWNRISGDKKSSADKHGERSTLLEKIGCCKTYIGISYPNVEEFISFSFGSLDSNVISEDINVKGFSFKQRLNQNNSALEFVLKRKKDENYEVFSVIAEDVFDSLSKNQHELDTNAYFLILQRIRLWISFLGNSSSNLLSLREEVGLYGELSVLLKTYDNYENCKAWLNSWKGAEKEAKDFISSDYELEVKTTLGVKDYVHISNEFQLETNIDKPLFLKTLVLEESPNGQTLPELVDIILGIIYLDQKCLDSFLIKLKLVNYSHLDKSEYNHKFSINRELTYIVESDFPSITSKKIPLGIDGVKYKINVNEINKFLVEENRLFMEQ